MKLTFEELSQMLLTAVKESDEAVNQYEAAQKNMTRAKAEKQQEASIDGRVIVRPIDKIMKELLDSADVPESAMPGGKATGGNADERKAARLAWVRKNNNAYRQYEDTLNSAEFREQLATGAAKVAELAADAARAKVNSYGGFALYFAAQMNNETERLKLAGVKASTPEYEDTERGRQYTNDYAPHFGEDCGSQIPIIQRTPQKVDDGVF